jgi:antitoxin component of RelBE/YafQ-DinJ toxin-antitoxin module
MTKRQLLAFARHYVANQQDLPFYVFTPDKLVALVRALHDIGVGDRTRAADMLSEIDNPQETTHD